MSTHNYPPPKDPPKYPDNHDKNNLQAQLEAQAQAQAELQAQLQLQGQGQGQGQHQSQHQESDNINLNGNGNGNLNLNGNANLNANVNLNKTDVCVDVKVNADVCSPTGDSDNHQYDHQYGIDMSHADLCFPDNDGIINVNPEVINQVLNGGSSTGGTNVLFNLGQVNNLVDNDKAEHIKNSDGCSSFCFGDVKGEGGDISIGGSDGKDGKDHGGPPKISFGGHDDDGSGAGVQIGSNNGAGSTNSTLVDASGNVSIDALTQSIVLGANVQTNSFNMNNAGHDITVTDHGSDHHA
jgi:hypothetical protein